MKSDKGVIVWGIVFGFFCAANEVFWGFLER